MMQELFGGTGLIGGERKISINGSNILEGTSFPSSSPSPFSSSTTTKTTTTTTAANGTTNSTSSSNSADQNQNLRCPRCDSSNTKFCYYNNYNLTQPRHFCKTCRRYWTKGGALRNVPIGGGCRKNKNTTISTAITKSGPAAGKMKSVASEIGIRSSFIGSGFDHELPSSPVMWASPQNSHLLALLRAAQNPNPNAMLSSPIVVKEEVGLMGSHMVTEPAGAVLNGRTLQSGLDPLGQVPSLGLCSPFWRNNQLQLQQQQQQNGFMVGHEAQNNAGIQDLYQRLRSSANYYPADHPSPAVVLSNVGSNSTSASSILESAPVTASSELGYWNPAFSWADLPAANGAYP